MKRILFSIILSILFTTSVIADDKPIHISKSLADVVGYVGVDLGTKPFDCSSEHFHFVLNFDNRHTLILSKSTRYMFIGVGLNTAYYVYMPKEGSNIEIYRVCCEDKESPITKLFLVMQEEWMNLMKNGHNDFRKKKA